MRIIRPATINDAALTASTVPETAPAAYAGGTTYALGARVSVFSGTVATVYESLQASNTGHTPASSPTWWAEVGTTYSTYSTVTTYAQGAIVIDPVAHRAYESVQASNLNHALTDPTWWLDLGPTNRWRMFDQSNSSQTTAEEVIQVQLLIPGRVNGLALLNIEAETVDVVASIGATEVYNQSFTMSSSTGIADWYDYFFEEIVRKPDLVVADMPNYSNMAITVTISRPGGTVRTGVLVVGQTKDLGMTLAGMGAGIIDFSRKETDDFGNAQLVERAFAKRLDARVVVENSAVDSVTSILSQLRATPTVWIAASQYSAATIFGFYRNFSVTFEYPTQSICLLEIEGLT